MLANSRKSIFLYDNYKVDNPLYNFRLREPHGVIQQGFLVVCSLHNKPQCMTKGCVSIGRHKVPSRDVGAVSLAPESHFCNGDS